jgi:predicted transcriptional regulator
MTTTIESTARSGGVRERRCRSGATQQELAVAAGVSIGYIQNLDHGYEPDPAKAPRYRAVLRALDQLERRSVPEEVKTGTD